MAAASGQLSKSKKEVERLLTKVDVDLRDFSECWKLAHSSHSSEQKEMQGNQLRSLNNKLQRHQAYLWNLSSGMEARNPSKAKVDAARARLDREMQRFQVFERGDMPSGKAVLFEDAVRPVVVANKAKAGDALHSGEVKILEDQLLRGSDDGEIIEEFVCKICLVHVVGRGPKLAACSHIYCGDCLAEWFKVHRGSQSWAERAKSSGSDRVVPCPVCKQSLHEERDLYQVCATGGSESAALWGMLEDLKIVCANHPSVRPEGCCDWRGTYGSFQEHIRTCKNLPMSGPSVVSSADKEGIEVAVGTPSPPIVEACVAPPVNEAAELTVQKSHAVQK
eukprot:CAMPEP_0170593522 /NCGR_PEP_ID=MMETSP0224-20130122/13494_1 /TAXON_ID=285029 /ORGANISM="Togula jolla, Strain CCCM 725" /LENGTH=334 /DNA_ID=CAMNT_0010917483 /DNA_START=72 /DNA_END=1073 /DNA_ORIENTATION=+